MAARNPFDQFDEQPVLDPAAPAPAPAPAPGGALPAGNPPSDNPFNDPVAPTTSQLSDDEFASQLYRRLNNGDRPEDILSWAKGAGHEIVTEGGGGEAWLQNLAIRDAALSQGQPGRYGRVTTSNGQGMNMGDTVGGSAAFLRKMGNVPLFYFGDEAVAAGLALGQEGGYWDNYENNWRRLNARDQTDEAVHPEMSMLGEGTGMGLSMLMPGAVYDKGVRMLAPAAVSKAGNLATRMGVGAATGAAAGATAATGEGSVDDRFQFTTGGTVTGALIGAGFPLVAEGLGRLARPIRERLFGNSERAMGDRLELTNAELAGMEAELARQRALGQEPALLDVLPEHARNRIGMAGSHDSARNILQDEAELRTRELPGRVTQRAREEISVDTRTPDDFQREIGAHRDAQMDADMAAIRDVPVPISQELVNVLGTGQGRTAIRNAINAEPDLNRRMVWMRTVQALDQLESGIDPRLPERIRQQIQEQIMPEGVTVGFLDRVQRELSIMADAGGTNRAALGNLRDVVKNAASQNPAYVTAQRNFATRSRSMEAPNVGTGGTFNRQDTRGFLSEDPQRFEEHVASTSTRNPWDYDRQAEESLNRVHEYVRVGREREIAEEAGRYNAVNDDTLGEIESIFDGTVEARLAEGDNTLPLAEEDITFLSNYNPEDIARAGVGADPDVRRLIDEYLERRRSGEISNWRDRSPNSNSLRRPNARAEEAQRRGIHQDYIDDIETGRLPGQENIVQMQRERPVNGRLETDDYQSMGSVGRDQPTGPGGEDMHSYATRIENEAVQQFEAMSDDELFAAMERTPNLSDNPPLNRVLSRRRNANAEFDVRYWQEYDRIVEARNNRSRDRERRRDARERDPNSDYSAIKRHHRQPGPVQERGIKYVAEDGTTLTGMIEIKPNSDIAVITVNGIGDWSSRRGAFGPRMVKEAARLIRREYPQIRYIAGSRVTGARSLPGSTPLDPYQLVRVEDIVERSDAPTERELARAGAAHSVAREAGKGPSEARELARDFINSPDQQRRTKALIGEEGAARLSDKMAEEVKRVYRVNRQATREGPSSEDSMAIVESGANALYNPTSPIPWVRETARFLHRIGLREEDARWMVQNALDKSKTDELIAKLKKHGMNREKALVYIEELRDAFVKYSVAQEGGSE